MRTLLALVVVLLSSCAPKLTQTPVSPVAPTVRKPVEVKPVDLTPVRDRTKQVEESNRQLVNELSKNKLIVFDLKHQLQKAEVASVVTLEQWEGINARTAELVESISESEKIISDQHAALVLLADAVTDSSAQVKVVQGSLDETQAALDDANANIAALNDINQTAQRERDLAVKAAAESSGTISEVRKSKTRWMLVSGVATACAIGLAYLLFKP